ncbi:hypothetical protein COT75_05460 [Candidatus Beckwithbacteria bacterium CG10_big_fil_rev_8_21_14_0_10_34_10]|uniref:Uncharacterized protein n=1 Tax=Candidatus Beckwithbacteria bacterium CG10_big_fil_rev_8_21_14_0_10_34_10 TaxID=1974495 RepID=A0A2H0W7X9_9BACT|nr:MAG: hypothetical protein COT75_05460 [Candidatus Beckwithbacteria bacterium CG10_big_fil_rev_8_21_14_0_10_34_10]
MSETTPGKSNYNVLLTPKSAVLLLMPGWSGVEFPVALSLVNEFCQACNLKMADFLQARDELRDLLDQGYRIEDLNLEIYDKAAEEIIPPNI